MVWRVNNEGFELKHQLVYIQGTLAMEKCCVRTQVNTFEKGTRVSLLNPKRVKFSERVLSLRVCWSVYFLSTPVQFYTVIKQVLHVAKQ